MQGDVLCTTASARPAPIRADSCRLGSPATQARKRVPHTSVQGEARTGRDGETGTWFEVACLHVRRRRADLSGVSIQRNARNVTTWRRYCIGQSRPPATTAYAAGTLPSCGRSTHAIKYEIIETEFDLRHKLHNKYKTYWNLDDWFFSFLNLENLRSWGKKTALAVPIG